MPDLRRENVFFAVLRGEIDADDGFALKADAALLGDFQRVEAAQKGGFARARGPKDDDHLPFGNV